MTLDDDMYMGILERVGYKPKKKNMVKILREWDDARTRLNPNAKWYDLRNPEPTTVEIADVITVLTAIAKERHSANFIGQEEVIETLIEVENRIRRMGVVNVSDLIDRDETIKQFCRQDCGCDPKDCPDKTCYEVEIIESVPTHETPSNTLGALDCVSRQDAIDALKICDNNEDGINCYKCPLRDERWDGAWQDDETNCYTKLMRDSAKLLEMPSVQKTGKWIDGRDERFVKCSECGLETTKNELMGISLFGENEPYFCPNCGARMVDKDE